MSFSSRNDGERPEAAGGDRRIHERRTITPRLYVILDDSKSDGILNDVSESGAALDILGEPPQGEYVVVDFEMSEIGQRFEAKGRVTWRDESERKVGVHFVDLPEASRNQIRKWLAIKAVAAQPPPSRAEKKDGNESAFAQPHIRQAEAQPPFPDAERARPVPAEKSYDKPQTGAPPQHGAATPDQQQIEPRLHSEVNTVVDAPLNNKIEEAQGSQVNDRLVQNLLDSFNQPQKKSKIVYSNDADSPSRWPLLRWILVGFAIGLAALLGFEFATHRFPQVGAESISVSKAGQRPIITAGQDIQTSPSNNADSGGNVSGGENGSSAGDNHGNGDGTNAGPTDPQSPGPSPAFLASLAASLPPGTRPPCVNLGPASDKIRIYIWTEKATPDTIVATYSKYLKTVLDVRVVDKAPYDLVLYLNGANAGGGKDNEAGYIWSSRVFRPWYCGESLGVLEKPEVNESLYYVKSGNLDQRIQAEVAYLILHTLEAIRTEQTK